MSSRIQDAHQAASQLEAYFLRRVLAEVKSSEEGLLSGGFAGGMFKDMFDEAVADKMSQAGGVGIADMVAKQIDPNGTTTKSSKTHAPGAAAAAPVAKGAAKTAAENAPVALADPKPAVEAHSIRPHDPVLKPLHPFSPLVPPTTPAERPSIPTTGPDELSPRSDTPAVRPGTVSIRRAYESASPSPSSSPEAGRPVDRR